MIKRYLPWAFAAAVLSFTACINNDIPDPTPPVTSGTADFSTYIAVGTSLTAGEADGGLYNAGIQAAFPNLLAGQFALAGGGSFTSPLFPANQADGTGYLKLTGLNADGTPIITQVAPQAIRGQTTYLGTPVTLYTKYTGNLSNFGIPGIKVANVLDPNYGNVNGFYERLLAGNAGSNTTSYLIFTISRRFTFSTVELGSNDALDYATSDGMTASRALTDQTVFSSNYGSLLGSLSSNIGAPKLVLATIPDVTILPYFHYITVALLKAVAVKKGITPNIYIQALNASGTYTTRQATDADLIMLTVDPNQIGGNNPANGNPGYGTTLLNPLPSSVVLDAAEVALVQNAITGYNNSIKTIVAGVSNANSSRFVIFDAYALFNQLQNGVMENGITINTNYITGGVFSLDGIHLTPRGNAAVNNEFIKVINAKYSSTLPAIDISKYKGVIN